MGCKVGRFAIDRRGSLIQAAQAFTGWQYRCPHCKGRLYAKRSKCGRAFFAHERKRSRKRSHDFSEHRVIQEGLAQLFARLDIFYKLEYEVCAGLRADIFFLLKENDNLYGYVIEVQRSPITFREIVKRMRVYERSGIGLIWIIPKQLCGFTQFHQWEQYLAAYAPLLLFYDTQRRKYYYVSDYLKCSITKLRIVYQHYKIANIQFLKRKARTFPHTQRLQISEQIFKQELIFWRAQRRKLKRRDNLQTLLYELQFQVDEISQKCYTLSIKFLITKQSLFFMQTILYLLISKKEWELDHIIKYCVEQQLLLNNQDYRDIINYSAYILRQ